MLYYRSFPLHCRTLTSCVSLVFLLDSVLRSVTLEGSSIRFLLVFQAFVLALLDNLPKFSEALFILLVESLGPLIPNLSQNMDSLRYWLSNRFPVDFRFFAHFRQTTFLWALVRWSTNAGIRYPQLDAGSASPSATILPEVSADCYSTAGVRLSAAIVFWLDARNSSSDDALGINTSSFVIVIFIIFLFGVYALIPLIIRS